MSEVTLYRSSRALDGGGRGAGAGAAAVVAVCFLKVYILNEKGIKVKAFWQ